MDNYRNLTNRYRRYQAHVSVLGTTQLHLHNPYIVAWWSAAFPGFGHLLLSKYLRGYTLFIWEVIVNVHAHINVATIDSFQGHFEQAKFHLQPRWMLMNIPVFIFGIWDSYRTCVDMNNTYLLAKRENAPFTSFTLGAAKINYLDKRNPAMSILWSLFMPGLGQLHIHRIVTALFAMAWGPIFWGLIGAASGFLLGFFIDLCLNLTIEHHRTPSNTIEHHRTPSNTIEHHRPITQGKYPQVILVIECEEKKADTEEHVLWHYSALGVARVKPRPTN